MFKDKKTVFGKAIACLLMAFVIVTSVPATIAADAATGSMPKMIDNTWNQLIKTTYMTATDSGYMRVVGDDDTSTICVEYYDNSFMMTGTKNIKKELPIWGGFYEGSDAYYIVVGKKNTNCVDNTEVIRIIKYDKSWNRLGAGSIRAKEGWDYEIRYPFDYGCVSMTESDGKLYVATGREGYVDPSVGQGHQGMMLIRMDETSFATETPSFVIVGEPYFLSIITMRPHGPSVVFTAFEICSTPESSFLRASSLNNNCFAIFYLPLY